MAIAGPPHLGSLFRATESGPASLYLAAGPLFTAQMVIGSTGSTAKLLETGWRPPNHRQLLDVDVARVVASCPGPMVCLSGTSRRSFLFSLLRLGGCRPEPSILFPQSCAHRKGKIKAICFFPFSVTRRHNVDAPCSAGLVGTDTDTPFPSVSASNLGSSPFLRHLHIPRIHCTGYMQPHDSWAALFVSLARLHQH